MARKYGDEDKFPATLPGLLSRNARRYEDRTGLREKDFGIWQETSWEGYYKHVEYCCLGLRELGLKRGDRLAILGDNCREWIYADMAAQSTGAVGVGVYPTSPANQVGYIVGHSDSVMVVVKDQEQADKILDVRDQLPKLRKIIVIDMKGLKHYDEPDIIPYATLEEIGKTKAQQDTNLFTKLISDTTPDDIALMVYTSGTTGPPKGAMLTHHNLLALSEKFWDLNLISDADQVVSYLPLCHIAERLMSLILALYAGYTVNFSESIGTVQESLYEISPSIFVGVPRIWEKMHASIEVNIKDSSPLKRMNYKYWMRVGRRLLERRIDGKGETLFDRIVFYTGYLFLYRSILDKLGLLRVRFPLSGAAPISPEILKFFQILGLRIYQVYGQTEVTGVSHIQHGDDLKIGSVGKPFKDVACRLAEDGEIMLSGNTLFAGYYKDLDATSRTVQDGWLYTGDIGEMDEEGYLFITDRKKDILITSGGKNIAPSEIENHLKFSPYINEAIVVGNSRPYLCALIQIEMDTVSKWAMDNKIAFTTFKSLALSPEVYDLIKHEVNECNKAFSQVETVKIFTLLDKELDHDDDELTATMKVRRKTVEEKFKDIIDSMYKR